MKKILFGTAAVFVTMSVLDVLIHSVILAPSYKETASLWRPDMESKMWIYSVISLVGSFFFSYVFSKGYKGGGVVEGMRYGLFIGIWLSTGMAYGTYGMIAIPYAMALQWFLYGVLEYIACGVVVALVFGKKPEMTGI